MNELKNEDHVDRLLMVLREMDSKIAELPPCHPESSSKYEEDMKTIISLMRSVEAKDNIWDFSRERESPIFVQKDNILIRPITPFDCDFYTEVRIQNSRAYKVEIEASPYKKISYFVWDAWMERSFFCIIEKADEHIPVGYIGIKDTSKDIWEIAIELEKNYLHQGFGSSSIRIFLNEINRTTGRAAFRAKVAPDNIPSQGCFEKIEAKLVGICPSGFLPNPEEQERFERTHLDLIDGKIEQLADRLNVEPRKLLSHVLDYRITYPLD